MNSKLKKLKRNNIPEKSIELINQTQNNSSANKRAVIVEEATHIFRPKRAQQKVYNVQHAKSIITSENSVDRPKLTMQQNHPTELTTTAQLIIQTKRLVLKRTRVRQMKLCAKLEKEITTESTE